MRVTSTFVLYDETVHVPAWIHDLTSFRRWVHSDEFPETGRICYLAGEVWVDMSNEQIFWHNQVKNEYSYVLTGLTKAEKHGRFFPDGLLLTNTIADFTCQPDGTFVLKESLQTAGVRLVEGTVEGHLELEGIPDMVLEVVSPSSVHKDTVILRDLYARAGIPEFWLVDVRNDQIRFDILRLTAKGYVATRKQAGWIKSMVLGKSFRLTCEKDEQGNPDYTLAVR